MGHPALLVVLGTLLSLLATSAAAAEDDVTFVRVALDEDTKKADRKLEDYLERTLRVELTPEEREYRQVIERLVTWDPSGGIVLARTTPYVQVVSEMLGADLEVLGTYVSKATNSTTYHAYYVVRKDDLSHENPRPEDVISYVFSRAPERARFTYHNLFSTSSFFLPSLHFRANGVFHMPEATGSLAAIAVAQAEVNSSSHLVRMVARGEADLAAVWDGTRARFVGEHAKGADAELGQRLFFVQMPSSLPNDLLVCSRSAPDDFKESVRAAIREMPESEIAVGDFARWMDIVQATEARAALAQLRWLAREQVPAVTIDVRAGAGSSAGTAAMVEAAEHAVRLSGTELVLYDKDFHEQLDTVWTLDEIHDGAARLTTSLRGTEIPDQVFPISFRDSPDLTRRIVDIARSRLHLVRYVWPYSGMQPMLIRDNTVPLAVGSMVPVQKITWLNPEHHDYRAGPIFDATVEASSRYVHELKATDFWPAGGVAADFDPMSNVSYRAYQLRVKPDNTWFRVATGALVVLLILAAIAAVSALRRRKREQQDALKTATP